MALTKLPGLSLFITLSFQSVLILGDAFLAPETNKENGLKITEKRVNNFRVPMDMPYDPNFWPARGRRSRRYPEKTSQNDDCEDGSPFDKTKIQCQETSKIHEEKSLEGKFSQLDFELMPPFDTVEGLLTGIEKTENCYEGASTSTDRLKGPQWGILDERFVGPKQFDETRHKKQKHLPQPQLIFYGNGVYWQPENLFGEKKKKQDVFWVARGKKNFNLNYP